MTKRALVISLLIVAVMAAIQPWNDFYFGNTYIQGNHFPIGVVFVLALFVAFINPLVRMVRPAWAFKGGELLSIWCIVVVGMSVPGSALLRYLYNMMASLPVYATKTPALKEAVLPNLPAWIMPTTDPASSIVVGFRESARTGTVPWNAWLRPTLLWCIFFGGMMWMMFCLTTIFRKQWVEYERLSFPLVQLPLEMCKEPAGGSSFPPLFRYKAFWVGVLIPVIVHGINGTCRVLNRDVLIPVPYLLNIGKYIDPAYGLGWVPISIYFSVIALGFLLTKETTLSLWLFFVFFQVEKGIAAKQGVHIYDLHPFTANQIFGAYLVFTAGLLWQARKHLARVFVAGVTFRRTPDYADEFMSYPAAVWGLVLSVGVMAVWSAVAASGGIVWAVLSALLWMMVLLVITRTIAQAGLLFVQCPFASPHLVPKNLGLMKWIGTRSYAISAVQGRILWDIREVMMPNAMNSARICQTGGIAPRKLIWGLVLALVVALACASASQLKLAYMHGSLNWADHYATRMVPDFAAGEIAAKLRPSETMPGTYLGLGLGLGIALGLVVLRGLYFWWPLAPIGILFAGTYPLRMMWFSLFLAWLFKWLVMRYGGGRTYRTGRGICLGMLMGDALIAGVWAIVGLALGRSIYSVLPG